MVNIGADGYQKLGRFDTRCLDCVEQRSLTLGVNMVRVSTKAYKYSTDLSVALSRCVEERRLSVGIYLIDFASAIPDKVRANLGFALSCRVEEWSLVQVILESSLNALGNQVFHHSQGPGLVRYEHCIEHSVMPRLLVDKRP